MRRRVSVKVDSFDYVRTGERLALVRVNARCDRDPGTADLLVTRAQRVHRIAALPVPEPAPIRQLRMAFLVSADLVGPDTSFSLHFERLGELALTRPAELDIAGLSRGLLVEQGELVEALREAIRDQQDELTRLREELDHAPGAFDDPLLQQRTEVKRQGEIAAEALDAAAAASAERDSADRARAELELRFIELESSHDSALHAARMTERNLVARLAAQERVLEWRVADLYRLDRELDDASARAHVQAAAVSEQAGAVEQAQRDASEREEQLGRIRNEITVAHADADREYAAAECVAADVEETQKRLAALPPESDAAHRAELEQRAAELATDSARHAEAAVAAEERGAALEAQLTRAQDDLERDRAAIAEATAAAHVHAAELDQTIADLQRRFARAGESEEALRQTVRGLQQQLTAAELELGQTVVELVAAHGALAQTRAAAESAEHERQAVVRALDASRRAEAEIKRALAATSAEVSGLRRQVAELEADGQRSRDAEAAAQARLAESLARAEGLLDERADLERQLAELRHERAELANAVETTERELAAAYEQATIRASEAAAAHEQVVAQAAELDRVSAELTAGAHAIAALRAENDQAHAESAAHRERLTELEQEQAELREKLEHEHAQRAELDARLAHAAAQETRLAARVAELQAECDRQAGALAEADQREAAAAATADRLVAERLELEQEADYSRQELARRHALLYRLERELSAARDQVDASRIAVDKAEAERKAGVERAAHLEERVAELERERDRLAAERSQLSSALDRDAAERGELSARLAAVEAELTAAREQAEMLKAAGEEATAAAERVIALEHTAAQLRAERDGLLTEKSALSEALDRGAAERAKFSHRVATLEEALASALGGSGAETEEERAAALGELRATIAARQAEIDQLRAELHAARREVDRARTVSDAAEARLAPLGGIDVERDGQDGEGESVQLSALEENRLRARLADMDDRELARLFVASEESALNSHLRREEGAALRWIAVVAAIIAEASRRAAFASDESVELRSRRRFERRRSDFRRLREAYVHCINADADAASHVNGNDVQMVATPDEIARRLANHSDARLAHAYVVARDAAVEQEAARDEQVAAAWRTVVEAAVAEARRRPSFTEPRPAGRRSRKSRGRRHWNIDELRAACTPAPEASR